MAYGNSRPACGPGGFIAGRGVRVCFFGYFLCTSKESDTRVSAKRFKPRAKSQEPRAKSQEPRAKSQEQDKIKMDPSLRRDDGFGVLARDCRCSRTRLAVFSRAIAFDAAGAKSLGPRLRGDDELRGLALVLALALALALALLFHLDPREARQAGRVNPAGAAHRDVRRFRRHRMCLTEIPGLLANPHSSIVGARRRAAFFWLLFLAVQRKVTRALARNAFDLEGRASQPRARSRWIPACAGMTVLLYRSGQETL